MKYQLVETTKFRRDLKRISKRNIADYRLVSSVLYILRDEGFSGIPKNMRPHKLTGNDERKAINYPNPKGTLWFLENTI